MSEKSRYFKIGLFAFIATGLLAFGLIVFGAGDFLKKEIMVETYFGDSIQGLDVGSPVKYRGVQVGEVKEITFVKDEYLGPSSEDFLKYAQYVTVKFSLNARVFPTVAAEGQDYLNDVVKSQGLRVKLAFIGITGLAYIEADFVGANAPKALPITWTPHDLYIPSMTHTFARLEHQINLLLDVLEGDIDPMIHDLRETTKTLPEVSRNLNVTIEKAGVVMDNLNDVLVKSKPVVNNLAEITATAKKYPSQFVFGSAPPKSKYDR